MLRIAAHVFERQHCDRRSFRQGKGRVDQVGCIRRLRLQMKLIDADRPRDVLEVLVSSVFEGDVQPFPDKIAHSGRYGDSAWPCNPLQPRRDVHAVAEDVAILQDDVSQINADPELNAVIRRNWVISNDHRALYVDSTGYRFQNTLKLGENAIADELYDPAVVLCNLRVQELALVGHQRAERRGFVGLHEPTEANDVSGEDRCQSAVHRRPPTDCIKQHAIEFS
ncbi:hypothetical protein GGE07_006344 [Sinorhizobium terangae]|nr:hypothetical protein [Sinorhizobium terangae]MBB4189648.1 hypothetical protein [Sinorhizobium terangae]